MPEIADALQGSYRQSACVSNLHSATLFTTLVVTQIMLSSSEYPSYVPLHPSNLRRFATHSALCSDVSLHVPSLKASSETTAV